MSSIDYDDSLSSAGYRIVRRFGAGIPDGCSIPLSLKLEEEKQIQQQQQQQRKLSVHQQIQEEIVRRSYGSWSRRSVIAPWVYQEANLFQSEIIQKARQKAEHHRSLLSKLRKSLFPKRKHRKTAASLTSDGNSEHESIDNDPNSVSSSSLGFFVDPSVPDELKVNPELLLLNLPEPSEESDRQLLNEIKEGLRIFRRSVRRSTSSANSAGSEEYEADYLDDKEDGLSHHNSLEMSHLDKSISPTGLNGINFSPDGVTFISSGYIHNFDHHLYIDDDDGDESERTRL